MRSSLPRQLAAVVACLALVALLLAACGTASPTASAVPPATVAPTPGNRFKVAMWLSISTVAQPAPGREEPITIWALDLEEGQTYWLATRYPDGYEPGDEHRAVAREYGPSITATWAVQATDPPGSYAVRLYARDRATVLATAVLTVTEP